jgi:hypothetical protein
MKVYTAKRYACGFHPDAARSKNLGEAIAHTALNRYMTRSDARPALLLEYARELGVLGPVRRALDVMSAR